MKSLRITMMATAKNEGKISDDLLLMLSDAYVSLLRYDWPLNSPKHEHNYSVVQINRASCESKGIVEGHCWCCKPYARHLRPQPPNRPALHPRPRPLTPCSYSTGRRNVNPRRRVNFRDVLVAMGYHR